MTLRQHITRIATWWRRRHPSRELERAIPEYRDAVRSERRALQSGCTRAIGRARKAKAEIIKRRLAAEVEATFGWRV